MTIYDVFNLYSRILHEQLRKSPTFLMLFVSLFTDTLFSCNNQNSMGCHGQNGPHSAISQNLALNLKYKGNRKGKQINILILCKNWTYILSVFFQPRFSFTSLVFHLCAGEHRALN